MELEYAPKHMRMLVRDDGVGIDPEVVKSGDRRALGPVGHARARASGSARASRSGAAPAAGTEVELSVPGQSRSGARPAGRRVRLGVDAEARHAIRVFSVDDHPLLREGIAAIINSQPDMQLVAQASTGREAIQQFREHRPDVTLMDLRLPDISGIDAMIAIRSEFPEARIVMLTTFEGDVEIQRALAAGARGYVLKSMPPKELVDVVRQVHAGQEAHPARGRRAARRALSRRGADRSARSTCCSTSPAATATATSASSCLISEETVKVHVKHIMEKLGASDRTEAVAIAVRRGIIEI